MEGRKCYLCRPELGVTEDGLVNEYLFDESVYNPEGRSDRVTDNSNGRYDVDNDPSDQS